MTRQSYFAKERNVSMEIKLWEPRVFMSQSQCSINSFVGSEQITLVRVSDLPSVTRDKVLMLYKEQCYEQLCH